MAAIKNEEISSSGRARLPVFYCVFLTVNNLLSDPVARSRSHSTYMVNDKKGCQSEIKIIITIIITVIKPLNSSESRGFFFSFVFYFFGISHFLTSHQQYSITKTAFLCVFFPPTLTAERGSSEEVCDAPATSTPLCLLLLCPSADQEADAPSRAAMASTQTLRLPMGVDLPGEEAQAQCRMRL